MEQQQQTAFEGWAVVDVLGHQRYFGFVRTEYFGTTAFFRVETPAREQREQVIAQEREFVSNGYGYQRAGTKVVRAGKHGSMRLVGAGSIYMLTPSTRDEVVAQLDEADPCAVVSVTASDGTPVELAETPW